MIQRFEATLVIQGTDDADHLNLHYALQELIRHACAKSPDGRFDWKDVRIHVDPPSIFLKPKELSNG